MNGLNFISRNRKQYVSINGYDSNLADVKFGFVKDQFLVHCCF